MVIQNEEECRTLIDKLDQGLPPQIIHEIIIYLEKAKNTEFIMTLVKYLNNQNMQSRNSVWALSSQIAMIGEDVSKIKEYLKIQ
ncbi:MAG: hypothetical protein OES14_00640 [Nitrosopumilus sp.]|jgi:hypothetical protein|nr:hypothetical protein [Nitrosopumilus sp.]MDH3824285.1 hypothetical protein [Nitrosopumilus sp.]